MTKPIRRVDAVTYESLVKLVRWQDDAPVEFNNGMIDRLMEYEANILLEAGVEDLAIAQFDEDGCLTLENEDGVVYLILPQ